MKPSYIQSEKIRTCFCSEQHYRESTITCSGTGW